MGYRSDIVIAVAFKTKTHFDEVWAVYCIDPMVQKHNIAAQWKYSDASEFTPIIYFEAEGTKWYDGYEDVTGIERMLSLVAEFHEQRQMPFAWIKYRIGEEITDVETTENSGSDPEQELMGELWERVTIERHIEHSF